MRRILLLAAVFVALGVCPSAQAADVPLLAGQEIPVGVVQITNEGFNLTVKFDTTGSDWCITETHLQISSELAGIPQTKKGNPIPGQFEFNDEHPCVEEVEYTKTVDAANVVIAAHAVVYDRSNTSHMILVSDESTDVIEVNGVPVEGQKAELSMEPFEYPNCAAYRQDQPGSIWDNGVNYPFHIYGAKWIWNSPHPDHPIDGDVVTFKRSFDVPEGFIVGGFLVITADNGYEAMLNGHFLGRAQLGPGFSGTLREQVDAYPRVGDWGVASQFWQTVEGWPISDVAMIGENTLIIQAANEYMYSDDAYLTYPSMAEVATDPVPGASPGEDPCYNPAGLIFKLFVNYLSHDETAWGDGAPFPGKNWATYIEYELEMNP